MSLFTSTQRSRTQVRAAYSRDLILVDFLELALEKTAGTWQAAKAATCHNMSRRSLYLRLHFAGAPFTKPTSLAPGEIAFETIMFCAPLAVVHKFSLGLESAI